MDTAIRVIMWAASTQVPRIELHEEFGTRSAALNAARHMHKTVPLYDHCAIVGAFGQDLYKFETRAVVHEEQLED